MASQLIPCLVVMGMSLAFPVVNANDDYCIVCLSVCVFVICVCVVVVYILNY